MEGPGGFRVAASSAPAWSPTASAAQSLPAVAAQNSAPLNPSPSKHAPQQRRRQGGSQAAGGGTGGLSRGRQLSAGLEPHRQRRTIPAFCNCSTSAPLNPSPSKHAPQQRRRQDGSQAAGGGTGALSRGRQLSAGLEPHRQRRTIPACCSCSKQCPTESLTIQTCAAATPQAGWQPGCGWRDRGAFAWPPAQRRPGAPPPAPHNPCLL